MMRKLILSSAALSLVLALAPATSAQCVASDDSSGTQCTTLFAGQTIDAGTVCMTVNGDNLDVTYTTTGGWELTEAHLWVGTALSDMPQTKKGNPKIGNFPYNSGDITGSTSYTFSVALESLGFSCPSDDTGYYVAAHAALRKDNGDGTYQTETGWGDGDPLVEKGSWATVSSVTLTCDCGSNPPVDGNCETAYATTLGGGQAGSDSVSQCFTDPGSSGCDDDEDGMNDALSNKWGWQIGPISAGTTEVYNLHAGGGKCDTGKGFLAGTATVTYDGSNLTVDYEVTEPGYELGATHVYAGNSKSCTSAPGQFTIDGGSGVFDGSCNTVSFSTGSATISGDIYIIMHAEICPTGTACTDE
jgi:hypothetical protein